MKNMPSFLIAFFSICMLTLVFAQSVFAYLDPGTGSYIFQLLIAAFLGGIFIIKPYFLKIKRFFKKIFMRGKDEE